MLFSSQSLLVALVFCRRLRKQKLQSQNSICSSEDDGSTTRSPSQLSTPSEVTNSPRMSFPARENDATHSTNVVMGSIVSMATSMPNSSTEISKSILVQETHVTKQQQHHHHHQQQQHQQQQQPILSNVVLPASGISTSIPVQELVHTHNHTHTHMHHFAGGWPGQLLPLTVYPGPTHSPNKDKTSVPSTSSGGVWCVCVCVCGVCVRVRVCAFVCVVCVRACVRACVCTVELAW